MQQDSATSAAQMEKPKLVRQKDTEGKLKQLENERTAETKVTFTLDYNKKRGPDHGSQQLTKGQAFQKRK